MRSSSVAVRPMMSLARAVSCTPGSCTTTAVGALLLDHRLGTPRSLTRLCSVVMFCVIACPARASALGFRLPLSLKSCRRRRTHCSRAVGPCSRCARRQRLAVAKAHVDVVAVARDAGVAQVLVAQQVRMSPVSASAFFVSADFMSTCIRK
jgi:hypothetical protein